jgi:putative transposase
MLIKNLRYIWREEFNFLSMAGKYGGMGTSDIKRLKERETENRNLKQMFAELSLQSQLLTQVKLGLCNCKKVILLLLS